MKKKRDVFLTTLFVFYILIAIAWHVLFITDDEPIYLVVGILWFITAILIGKE